MTDVTKSDTTSRGKTRRYAWIFEELIVNLLLVVAVVAVIVEGVLSLNGSSIV